MPALDVMEAPNNEDPGPINPVVGIIYPPPEVRNIVDKTASFVARNGPEFEARIRQNELNNPKFDFLNAGNPYHAYYLQKVQDFGNGEEIEKSSQPIGTSKYLVHSAAQKQQEILNRVEQPFVPKEPPAEFEFIADPPSISALDLDIVKLTAQFVARNGKIFLTKLMNKEHRNIQFDFLRPQHSLFQYFTKLLEQYTKILIPPKNMTQQLREEIKSPEHVLDQVKYRVQWQKYEETQRAREEEILERERISYAQIDWHDFVVVEQVDYQPFEVGNFPPLTTPEEVGARVLIQERIDDLEDIEMEMESDEESSSDAEMATSDVTSSKLDDTLKDKSKDMDKNKEIIEETSTPNIQPLMPPVPGKVVVKQYDPKQAIQVSRPKVHDEYLVSPITGEKIPASKVQEHMRIGLLDPRWVEQHGQRTADKRNQEIVYAEGTAIDASLKLLAERRTDIFGVGDEETAIGKKIGEEDVRKDEKATWDGCMSSVEAATRAARANVTLEEQIHQIHKVKGLLPDERKEKIGPKNDMAQIKQHQMPSQQPPKPPVPVMQPQAAPRFIMPLPPPSMIPQPPVMMMTDPMMAMPQPPLMTLPPQPNFMPPVSLPTKHPSETISEEEPTNKRMRNEDSLIPESVFLTKNPSPVAIKVVLPVVQDKSEWKLNGQTINYTLPLSETVANLKTMLQKETGMVPSKQKLFYDGMFFKDSNTMAYYNITPGSVIQLQVKERGGRKK